MNIYVGTLIKEIVTMLCQTPRICIAKSFLKKSLHLPAYISTLILLFL